MNGTADEAVENVGQAENTDIIRENNVGIQADNIEMTTTGDAVIESQDENTENGLGGGVAEIEGNIERMEGEGESENRGTDTNNSGNGNREGQNGAG